MGGGSVRKRGSLVNRARGRTSPQTKTPANRAGVFGSIGRMNSVTRDDRAAELVVHASREEVDVFLDVVGEEAGIRDDVVIAHEQVIVLEAERPARSKGIFEADTDRGTPAGFVGRIDPSADTCRNGGVLVVGYRGAALHVEQCAVPGIANLAGEQAEGIDLG